MGGKEMMGEETPMGIILYQWHVDALANSDDLLLTTAYNVQPGLGLCIHTAKNTFWVKVLTVERLEPGTKHDWRVSVENSRPAALRRALTYRVAEKAPGLPELQVLER